eukprot:GHRQ01035985.1.p1 GENE.GHRQ01035985.1~~GHRQ01035985.1.p1  ORF type:complete len:257 (+),score=90.00 GHRQ01035985.1:364-1134(+)
MAAEKAMQALLESVGHAGQLDAELMEYISSLLEDPDPETCLEVLVELLAGALPCFNSKSSEQQMQLVLQLLDNVEALQAPQQLSTGSNPSSSNLDDVVAAFKQATLQNKQHDAACTDITNKQLADSSNSSSSNTRTSSAALPSQDLSALLALCPTSISQPFLAYTLQHSFRGDMQAAADWLLECPDLLARQEGWQEEQQAEQQRWHQEQEQRRQSRKQIVQRWAWWTPVRASRLSSYSQTATFCKSSRACVLLQLL